MGMFAALGNLAGGFSKSRDKRVAAKEDKKPATLAPGAADGVGGEPTTQTGTPLTKVGDSTKTLGQKIGSGMASAGKHILGFKTGGRITKSGVAYLHKGESIIPATQERKPLRMSARKSGRR